MSNVKTHIGDRSGAVVYMAEHPPWLGASSDAARLYHDKGAQQLILSSREQSQSTSHPVSGIGELSQTFSSW